MNKLAKSIMICVSAMALSSVASAKIVADFVADFNPQEPVVGWSYLWNPTGVEIGQRARYAPLVGLGKYRVVVDLEHLPGADTGPKNATYLLVKEGQLTSGDGEAISDDGFAHYAIAAYTIQPGEAGTVRIVESHLKRKQKFGSNDFRIYVNDELLGSDAVPVETMSAFDISLGELEVGDTIYFAVGGVGNKSGAVDLQFKIDVE